MLCFIIGLFVGAFIGIVLMCFCNIASNSDEELEIKYINKTTRTKAKNKLYPIALPNPQNIW